MWDVLCIVHHNTALNLKKSNIYKNTKYKNNFIENFFPNICCSLRNTDDRSDEVSRKGRC
jgi:hypothetical protein